MVRTRNPNKQKTQSTLPFSRNQSEHTTAMAVSGVAETQPAIHTIKATIDASIKNVTEEVKNICDELRRIETEFDRAIEMVYTRE